ncbi:MAG: glycosyltransferase [Gammaproteobacteria bacterium]
MVIVAHLTSAHPRSDTRIFVKQCRQLAQHGFDVNLVVADGLGDSVDAGVRVHDVGAARGRLGRMLATTRRVYRQARRIDAHIYHLHDPELIPVGLRLRQLGKAVIFDAHEDLPTQLLGKPYLRPLTRRLLSRCAASFEQLACPRFSSIVAATPFIRDKFLRLHPRTVDVNNFPLMSEFDAPAAWEGKAREVCYVGNVSAIRGVRELVAACGLLASDARLVVAGQFEDPALRTELQDLPGAPRVSWAGQLDRAGVQQTMGRAMAGLVTLHPLPNYRDALPVKMFEYMAAGIPVIASDFPRWRDIIDGHRCGICVNPFDAAAIGRAIDYIMQHPEHAREMGANGRAAVQARYNWSVESGKLIALYEGLLS